ncbi:hypothetical protein CsSME_00020565 [Camellia sinensis var. sinensis]
MISIPSHNLLFRSAKANSSVYPKVKVREQEEDDDLLTVYDHDKATHLSETWFCSLLVCSDEVVIVGDPQLSISK